jgi:hypothetical protein
VTEYPGSGLFPGDNIFPGTDVVVVAPVPGFVVSELEYPTVLASSMALVVTPDLIASLPPYGQDSQQIQNVLTVIANELARIEQARRNLIANWFPATAVGLLHFSEQQLGLPVDSTLLTLAERQQTVLTLMQSLKQSGTGLEWEANVTKLVGSNWTYQEHDPSNSSSPPPYTVLIKIPFVSVLGPPVGVATVDAGTGGSLSAGTFYYQVTGLTSYGESTPSAVASQMIALHHQINVTWQAQPNATAYNIYRGTPDSAMTFLATTTLNSFSDSGSAIPTASAPPTQDTSASPQASVADKLLRATTPAHIALVTGFSSGFLIGISQIGISAL